MMGPFLHNFSQGHFLNSEVDFFWELKEKKKYLDGLEWTNKQRLTNA